MWRHVGAVLCLAVTCTWACDLRPDLSPFYWNNSVNVCTKELCQVYDYLKCDIARDYINDQAIAHYPEDILFEVEQMKQYFDTFIPRPTNTLPYNCKGACQTGANQLQLQRIFTSVNVRNSYGALSPKHMMCIVIGPDIYYENCGGQCDLPNNYGHYCVPDVTVRVKLWVFCPDVEPGCHKVDFDVPLSCSCKKITCRSGITMPTDILYSPNVPPAPANWVPGNGAAGSLGVVNIGSPLGVALHGKRR